jgi:hypothetical protein
VILAKKNGWLEVVVIVKETRSNIHYRSLDSEEVKMFSRKDKSMKFFNSAEEATDWVLGEA